jgi:hypothetical protein
MGKQEFGNQRQSARLPLADCPILRYLIGFWPVRGFGANAGMKGDGMNVLA